LLASLILASASLVVEGSLNDTSVAQQWGWYRIKADQALDTGYEGAGVVVALLDTGIDAGHPDLAANIISGWNFIDNNSNVTDVDGHGTMVAGIVASVAAYTEGKKWLDSLMEYLDRNSAYIIDYCREQIPEIIPVRPEATYMIWLDCRKLVMSGKELGEFFVSKAGVGLSEGSSFGPGGEGFMRMNMATTLSKVKQAMDQIRIAVETLR